MLWLVTTKVGTVSKVLHAVGGDECNRCWRGEMAQRTFRSNWKMFMEGDSRKLFDPPFAYVTVFSNIK